MGHGTTAYTAFEDSQPRKRGGLISACWRVFCRCCSRSPPGGRLIRLNAGAPTKQRYPRNAVQNTKYSPITFVPKVLYEQFRCNVLRSGLPCSSCVRHAAQVLTNLSSCLARRFFQSVLPARGSLTAFPAAPDRLALHVRRRPHAHTAPPLAAVFSPSTHRPGTTQVHCAAGLRPRRHDDQGGLRRRAALAHRPGYQS